MLKSLFTPNKVSNIVLDEVYFEIKHTKRKKMKRIVLRVERQNEICISSSSQISSKKLEAFIYEQKEWILTRNSSLHLPFSQGSSFHYLGKEYVIEHHDSAFKMNTHSVLVDPSKAKTHSDEFYRSKAKEYIPSRINDWKLKMNLEFNTLNFRLAKRRWGSCSSRRVITLNPYMMKLSYEMIDYIIVHELAHLEYLNHSKDFYTLVEEYIPDYKNIEKQINALSSKITN